MQKEDTVYKYLKNHNRGYEDQPMLLSRNNAGSFEQYTYGEVFAITEEIGSGLFALGLSRGDKIGILSDNRKEWLFADLAMLAVGIIDVPRGCDTNRNEILYILSHAECKAVFLENSGQLEKLADIAESVPDIQTAILFSPSIENLQEKQLPFAVYTLDMIRKLGSDTHRRRFRDEYEKGCSDDAATIIYTSGTTGKPKGVILTNRSFLFQVDATYTHVPLSRNHRVMSILPSWHVFERAIEYIIFSRGCTMAYSKPVSAILLPDFQEINPHWMASVPRIWEAVRTGVYRSVSKGPKIQQLIFACAIAAGTACSFWKRILLGTAPEFTKPNSLFLRVSAFFILLFLFPAAVPGDFIVFRKIRKKLGSSFIAGISGGGALPEYLDRFYSTVGITVLEGYGLTEAAPILSVRKLHHPVFGTIGPPLPGVEFKLVTADGALAGPGEQGVLHVRSPQIMDGYFKEPGMTRNVLNADGWLNTGDIAIHTIHNELKVIGREKETIVLMGGENIEPLPMEECISQSRYIDQVMVVGQDRKYLGALVVPDFDELAVWAESEKISFTDRDDLVQSREVYDLINGEIQTYISTKNGFRPFERIFRLHILSKPFVPGREMTQTLKLRRNIIAGIYKKEIASIFEEQL